MKMRYKQRCVHLGWMLCSLLMIGGLAPALAVQEFHAYLMPDPVYVPLGTDFSVDFTVDGTARQFNGYEALIRFDPALAHFRSVEEGSLMTQACVNRFRVLSTPSDSTVDYVHVILCDGVSLDGPGTLSRYTFHADRRGIFELQMIIDPDRAFYDAGSYVAPDHPTYPRQVVLHAATVVIYDPATGVGDSLPTSGDLTVRQIPNPSPGPGVIQYEIPEAGPVEIEIVDPAGRCVWAWSEAESSAGIHRVAWGDSGDAAGRLSAGAYFCRIRAGRLQGGTAICVVR